MIRSKISGHKVLPRGGRRIETDRVAYKDSDFKPPEKMSTAKLRRMLCELGPDRCAACAGCAYGREITKRSETEKTKEATP